MSQSIGLDHWSSFSSFFSSAFLLYFIIRCELEYILLLARWFAFYFFSSSSLSNPLTPYFNSGLPLPSLPSFTSPYLPPPPLSSFFLLLFLSSCVHDYFHLT